MTELSHVAPNIIDAHCHFWRLKRGDYDWLKGESTALQPLRRDFHPRDYPGNAALIAVQAAPTVTETEYLMELACHDVRIIGIVGWVDLSSPNAKHEIERLSLNPLLRGIRPMLQDIENTDWLTDAAREDALIYMAMQGLVFDALVTERHLTMLDAFALRYNDLPIVVDHAAKPQPGDRKAWEAGLAALAKRPNIHCKLSGLLTELSDAERANPLPVLEKLVDQLLDWFGPERLIWGSDWPVLNLAGDWHQWRDLTEQLLSSLAAHEREAIVRGNAEALYGVTL